MTDILPGPLYRDGPITVEMYDEVIAELTAARNVLAGTDTDALGCAICSDSGCASNVCHHNALVMAREYVKAKHRWICWHCGYEARTEAEAIEHFGKTENEVAACVERRASMRLDVLAWFDSQHNLELGYYTPMFGDDDDQSTEWRVHRVNGGYNDREWTQIGQGQTVYEAILEAAKTHQREGGTL